MPANILVSRRPLSNTERNEVSKDTVRNLKQSIAQKHIEMSNKVKSITDVVEVIQKTSERHEEELSNIRTILLENQFL
jgi:gas vesicle protein